MVNRVGIASILRAYPEWDSNPEIVPSQETLALSNYDIWAPLVAVCIGYAARIWWFQMQGGWKVT